MLAGGRSTRMGRPKENLEWHGSTLLHRVTGIVGRAVAGVVVFVLVVELLNTAIEKLADRVNLAIDPQIGRVKDMGSAAVGLALLIAGVTWLLALAERLGLI